MRLIQLRGNEGNGVEARGIEVRSEYCDWAYTRCEVLSEAELEMGGEDGTRRCEHEELNGDDVMRAMIEVADNEAPDAIGDDGQWRWGIERISDKAISVDSRCEGEMGFKVSIVDCPETRYDPDTYLFCRSCAAKALGLDLLSSLIDE